MGTRRGFVARGRLAASCPPQPRRRFLKLVLAAAICAVGSAGCDQGAGSGYTPNPGVSKSMRVTGPGELKAVSNSPEWGAFLWGLAAEGKLVPGVYGFELLNSTGDKVSAVSLEVKREGASLNAYKDNVLVQTFPTGQK